MKKLFAIACTLLLLAACKSTDGGSGSWLGGDRSSTTGDQTNAVNVVYFAFDSSALDETAKGKLSQQAEMWKASNSKPMLVIEGHCDKVGDVDYNLALGERRAFAAKKELEKMGVSADKIETISYGKERPAVIDNDSLNRRAITLATK
jgi:peptidoglycan-associated lipoprotein